MVYSFHWKHWFIDLRDDYLKSKSKWVLNCLCKGVKILKNKKKFCTKILQQLEKQILPKQLEF